METAKTIAFTPALPNPSQRADKCDLAVASAGGSLALPTEAQGGETRPESSVRWCSDCGACELDGRFGTHPNLCLDCLSARTRAWTAKHPGYKRPPETPEQRANRLALLRRWSEEHPGACAARARVKRALASGKLTKQPCVCGSLDVQAHHADYAKPLDVTWLCRKCHRSMHGEAFRSRRATA